MKIIEIVYFYLRIKKIMQILKFYVGTKKIMKLKSLHFAQNEENHQNYRIPFDNPENHKKS